MTQCGLLCGLLCGLFCLTALPGAALAAAYTVPGDESTIADALAKGDATKITLQGITDSSVSAIPAGVTLVLSGGPTLAVSGELTVRGAITGAGSISAGSVYVTRSGSVAAGVGYSGTVYWEQNIGIPGVTKIVGSDGLDASPSATGGGYYKTTVRYPSAVYVGSAKYVATGSGFLREYTVTYVSEDPNTPCTNTNPTVYTEQTAPFVLTRPTVTYSDYTFECWRLSNGTALTTFDPSAMAASGDVVLYAVWKKTSATGGGTMGGGGVAGGGSGTFSAAAAASLATDDDDDDKDETTATTGSGFGNMRVRMASSTTRHTVHSDTATDVQALANEKTSRSRFPWQWLGAGLGGLALITALCVTLKRRADERTAAMLEKLNIKE